MSILNGERVNALVSNNAWISKNSYASDSDYELAQITYSVPFPDSSKAHIYYNSVLKEFRFHDGLIWQSLSIGSTANKAFFHATISPTGQSLPAGTAHKIAWNSVIVDNEAKWDVINNQYEIPRDGKYLVTILNRTQQTTNAGAGNYFIVSNLYVNNSNTYDVCNYPQYFTSSGVLIGSRNNGAIIIDAIAGDLIDFRVFVPTTWASATVNGNQTLQDFKIIEL